MTNITKYLSSVSDPQKAKDLSRFFKTGAGEYGEGDRFLGVVVPQIRESVKLYWKITSIPDVKELLKSEYHEVRLAGLLVMVKMFEKGDDKTKQEIYDLYLDSTKHINNWDLVDLTAPNIVGNYLIDNPRDILYKLVKSNSLWERRISILATFSFIRISDFKDAIKIAKLLLSDKHDLIHKAVGWMLREVGKKDLPTLIKFLDENTLAMPRTMLRYSIEKLPERLRLHYLHMVVY